MWFQAMYFQNHMINASLHYLTRQDSSITTTLGNTGKLFTVRVQVKVTYSNAPATSTASSSPSPRVIVVPSGTIALHRL